jgi:excisionase family DNA binding protein
MPSQIPPPKETGLAKGALGSAIQEYAFLSLDQAAEALSCTRRFLEKRIQAGEIRIFRPSKRFVRIRRIDLESWIENYSARGPRVESAALGRESDRAERIA